MALESWQQQAGGPHPHSRIGTRDILSTTAARNQNMGLTLSGANKRRTFELMSMQEGLSEGENNSGALLETPSLRFGIENMSPDMQTALTVLRAERSTTLFLLLLLCLSPRTTSFPVQ